MSGLMIASLIVGVLGIGGLGFTLGKGVGGKEAADTTVTVDDKAEVAVQEVERELTMVDVLVEVCSPEYIAAREAANTGEAGDALCRETICQIQTRGTTGETSALQCEPISNVRNTIALLRACDQRAAELVSKAPEGLAPDVLAELRENEAEDCRKFALQRK